MFTYFVVYIFISIAIEILQLVDKLYHFISSKHEARLTLIIFNGTSLGEVLILNCPSNKVFIKKR